MKWFPQVGPGSITQFPFTRLRSWRAVRNELESGERIMLPDPAAGQIEWSLSYKDLNDAEESRLKDLFTSSRGSYEAFGFVDPLVNLLAWSEDLTRPDWQMGLLVATGQTLTNGSPGDQQLIQTVSLPGEYVTCFSAWIRSDTPCDVILQRDGTQAPAAAGPTWKRFFVSGAGTAGAENSSYSIVIPAGRTIQMWGPQVEAQPYPSQYKTATAAAGIYEETYFASDELTIANTAPGLYSCEFKLLSRV
jgi:hypothetical protein